MNLVELIADEKDCAYDQKCKYGYRVEGHAVYCHNESWKNAPRKCRKNWYWGDDLPEHQDENCEGFEKK